MMNGRRRQRNVIIDSSSSEEDEVVAVVMDNSNPTNRVGTLGLGWNDDASDSSSSLEGYLRALRVVDAPPEPENIEMAEEQEDVTSDLDDSSSGESEDLEDVEVMDEEVVVEPPPTRDEEEQAGIDVDSDFSLDRSANEVYLSSDKAKNNIQWPAFRVPVPLWKRLYDYQKTGVSWMAGLHANRVGGILGDDMGMVRCGACDHRIFLCYQVNLTVFTRHLFTGQDLHDSHLSRGSHEGWDDSERFGTCTSFSSSRLGKRS
jgi:SNF2 family DNA or RNA helicase